MGRLLGLDYGEKRIGIAASDPLQIIASPREVLHRTTIDADIDHIARIVEEDEVEAFVVGCPFNTDGTRNKMVERVEAFVAELTVRCPIPVHWVDETYSSQEAEEILRMESYDWRKRKPKIDMVAAQIILRNYLERPQNRE
jgi:putative Holliday junction resolvase